MDERIEKTLDYIEHNLDQPLDLQSLTEIANLSIPQFHRLFKTETGSTPFQLIEKIRMEKAYQLLLAGSKKVHELAYALNYKDYETFSRAFKKHFKMSPDNIKSISVRINQEVPGVKQIMIEVTDEEDEKKIIDYVSQLIKEKELTEHDLEHAHFFMIREKTDNSVNDKVLIKNKYEMYSDQKLWDKIINHDDDK